jgi:hypothetical protein
MKFDIDYFIAKYEAIPDELFTVHLFENYEGQKCSVGHCGVYDKAGITPESLALKQVLAELPVTSKRTGELVVDAFSTFPVKASNISDGLVKEYPQKTPKQRILAALCDAEVLQQVRVEEILEYELAVV